MKIKTLGLNALESPLDTPCVDWKEHMRNQTIPLLQAPVRNMNLLGNCFFLAFFPCLLAHRRLLFPPAQSSFMWSERIHDSVSFRPLLCRRAENDCFACSTLWHHMKSLRDSWHSLHPRIGLMNLTIQCPKFLSTPSPWLWFLDWGSLLFLTFHHSLHHHATAGVCEPSSLFCSVFNPHHYVPAFSIHLNPICCSPLTLFSR